MTATIHMIHQRQPYEVSGSEIVNRTTEFMDAFLNGAHDYNCITDKYSAERTADRVRMLGFQYDMILGRSIVPVGPSAVELIMWREG